MKPSRTSVPIFFLLVLRKEGIGWWMITIQYYSVLFILIIDHSPIIIILLMISPCVLAPVVVAWLFSGLSRRLPPAGAWSPRTSEKSAEDGAPSKRGSAEGDPWDDWEKIRISDARYPIYVYLYLHIHIYICIMYICIIYIYVQY